MSRPVRLSLLAVALVAAGAALWFALGFGAQRPETRPGLGGETRTIFTQAANEACLKAQTGAPDNASLSPAKIASFCSCYGDRLADAMTQADIDRLARLPKEQIVAAQEDKADEAFQACSGAIDDGDAKK